MTRSPPGSPPGPLSNLDSAASGGENAPHLAAAVTLLRQGGWNGRDPAIVVLGAEQRLHLLGEGRVLASHPVSTGAAGFGCADGSGCTPTGLHRIAARIGEGAPLGAVFKGRHLTGEVAPESTDNRADRITTRILWLEGLEPGHNRGPGVDTRERYIYLHGTPYAAGLGRPLSAGCIRLANAAVAELFERVAEGTLVVIVGDDTPT